MMIEVKPPFAKRMMQATSPDRISFISLRGGGVCWVDSCSATYLAFLCHPVVKRVLTLNVLDSCLQFMCETACDCACTETALFTAVLLKLACVQVIFFIHISSILIVVSLAVWVLDALINRFVSTPVN